MTSTKPCYIYPLRIEGTVDDRLLQLFNDKADAASLALDVRLVQNQVDDMDLDQLLAEDIENYSPQSKTVDETEMTLTWPEVRLRLNCAKSNKDELPTQDD